AGRVLPGARRGALPARRAGRAGPRCPGVRAGGGGGPPIREERSRRLARGVGRADHRDRTLLTARTSFLSSAAAEPGDRWVQAAAPLRGEGRTRSGAVAQTSP